MTNRFVEVGICGGDECWVMKRSLFLGCFLWVLYFPLCAQDRTQQDSLQLQEVLHGDGELKLNPEALRELWESPQMMSTDKPWMDFDCTLPKLSEEKPKQKMVLTLRPYKPTTRYNWDPILQKEIKVDEDTWKGPFQKFKSVEQQFARVGVGGGMDLMKPFTREFWDFKGRKRRIRTLEALRAYGDSVTIREKKHWK